MRFSGKGEKREKKEGEKRGGEGRIGGAYALQWKGKGGGEDHAESPSLDPKGSPSC